MTGAASGGIMFNADGTVDVMDLGVLANAYGADTHAGGEPAAVPQPGTLVLLAAGIGALAGGRKRSKLFSRRPGR